MASGVDKVLVKLSNSVAEGNYYEAHQMYHSVCQRYMKQKKPMDAIALVHSGAINLLKYDQIGSAADLAERMLDIYEQEALPVNDVNKGRILEIFEAFPLGGNTYVIDFLRTALRWSSKQGTCPTGDPHMHHIIGTRFFKEKEYYEAESHLCYGILDSAKVLGHLACEWSEQGYCGDKGYFIARSVLQLLAQKKLQRAQLAFETYRKDVAAGHPKEVATVPFRPAGGDPQNVPVFVHRLANLANMMIIVVVRDSADQFSLLRAQYREALGIDTYLYMLVDKIADVWFGLGPKKQPNIMEDLMKSLFAGPSQPSQARPAISEMD